MDATWTWEAVCAASVSRFSTVEIVAILANWERMGAQLSTECAKQPLSGSLYLYNSATVRNYRSDEVDWVRSANRYHRVNEKTAYLKISKRIVASCLYTRSDSRPSFSRRIYALRRDPMPPMPGETKSSPPLLNDIVLVHYFNEDRRRRTASLVAATRAPAAAPAPVAADDVAALALDALGIVSSADGSRAVAETERAHDAQFFVHDALASSSVQAPQRRYLVPLRLVDFAPTRASAEGGEKLLVCVEPPAGEAWAALERGAIWHARFGSTVVSATAIAPGVLRCTVPPSARGASGGRVAFEVRLSFGVAAAGAGHSWQRDVRAAAASAPALRSEWSFLYTRVARSGSGAAPFGASSAAAFSSGGGGAGSSGSTPSLKRFAAGSEFIYTVTFRANPTHNLTRSP